MIAIIPNKNRKQIAASIIAVVTLPMLAQFSLILPKIIISLLFTTDSTFCILEGSFGVSVISSILFETSSEFSFLLSLVSSSPPFIIL